jgi:3-isopropylmalate dehydrogenase
MGFELARGRRKKLASIDKANVLETSRLWRQVATDLAPEYPDVELEHVLVDTCAMQLIQRPSRFDVIVAENTFGDILTDEAAVLAASMGLLPSASLADVPAEGRKALGLYEPIHGTAPDIAGQGIANPIATILSVALMLRYSLGLTEEAAAVERAVDRVIKDGYRTPDIFSSESHGEGTGETRRVRTEEMGDRVVAAL